MPRGNEQQNDAGPRITAVPAGGLAVALATIMGDLGGIEHDGRNPAQGYQYTSYDAIAGRLRPLMAREGVVLAPVRVEVLGERDIAGRTSSWHVVRLAVTYRLTHAASGDSLDVPIVAEGADSSDKAIPKALTMAQKYLFKQVFLVSTGEDDAEADERLDRDVSEDSDHKQPTVTDEQLAELSELIERAGADVGRMLTHFGVPSMSELSDWQYRQAVALLQHRIKAQKGGER